MNFNTIAFSVLITFIISLLGLSYYLFENNVELKRELSLQRMNNASLQVSIDKQNSQIKILEARNRSLSESFHEVETKYEEIKGKTHFVSNEDVIKEYAKKHNISDNEAFCKIHMDIIEKGLDEFYKK